MKFIWLSFLLGLTASAFVDEITSSDSSRFQAEPIEQERISCDEIHRSLKQKNETVLNAANVGSYVRDKLCGEHDAECRNSGIIENEVARLLSACWIQPKNPYFKQY